MFILLWSGGGKIIITVLLCAVLCTSMYSLEFRVRRYVAIATQPCTDRKYANNARLGEPLLFPQLASGSVQ